MSLPIRYQPTYRLESKVPYKKEECEKVIKSIMDTTLETFVYESDEAEAMSKTLSTEILTKVKKLNFDRYVMRYEKLALQNYLILDIVCYRYKLVCVVTIGEKYMQSYCDIFKCLWDMQKDGYAFYVHDTPSVFAIAILYAVYCN